MRQRSVAAFFFLLLVHAVSFGQNHSGIDSLTIFHWNDFHAQNAPFSVGRGTDKYTVGGSASLAGFVASVRASNKQVLVLSAGDEFQGTPISSFTNGASQIEILNTIKPDAMTIGNHEFDYGAENLRANIAKAKFPVLCANVFDSTTNSTFALPFITKTVAGLKAGIIGVTSSGLQHLTLAKNRHGLRLLDMDSVINSSVAALRKTEKPDLIILLAHEGLYDDSLIAMKHPELDLIIAGHDHRSVPHAYKVNHTIIAEAGSKGQYVGELDLAVNEQADSIAGFNGFLHEMKEGTVQPDPAVRDLNAGYEKTVNERLSEVIGRATVPLRKEGHDEYESNLGDMECDAFLTLPGHSVSVAFVNSAGIRKNMDSGAVRLRDVWEVNPFGNTLVTFSVRGDTLRRMMEFQAGKPNLQVGGLNYTFNPSKPKGSRITTVTIGGAPLKDDAVYTIVTNNFVAEHFGDYFGAKPAGLELNDTGVIDRDMVIDYIKEHKVITAQVEGRIRAITE